jgi:hypothetical protein
MEQQTGAAEPLSDEQIIDIAERAHKAGKLSWLGFTLDDAGAYNRPSLSLGDFQLVRAVLAALSTHAAPARNEEDEPTEVRGLDAILDAWNALPDKLRLDPHLCKLFEAVRDCREVPARNGGETGEAAPAMLWRWIPVEERLPTHRHSVLGVVLDGPLVVADDPEDRLIDIVSFGGHSDPRWLQFTGGDEDVQVRVSHWMPRPDLPGSREERKHEAAVALAGEMARSFEVHTGVSWTEPAWREETALWAAAWRLAAHPPAEQAAREVSEPAKLTPDLVGRTMLAMVRVLTDDQIDEMVSEYRERIYPQDQHPHFERALVRAVLARLADEPLASAHPAAPSIPEPILAKLSWAAHVFAGIQPPHFEQKPYSNALQDLRSALYWLKESSQPAAPQPASAQAAEPAHEELGAVPMHDDGRIDDGNWLPDGDEPTDLANGWRWVDAKRVLHLSPTLGAQVAEPVAPADETVPVPVVMAYSGGAAAEGYAGRVWLRLEDGGPDVEYVRAPAETAARDVLAERQRQITAEGWTPEHDGNRSDGSLALAAACYARNAGTWLQSGKYVSRLKYASLSPQGPGWPWRDEWWKPTSERRDLVKAGALILAEIERLDRPAAPGAAPSVQPAK